MRTTSTRFKRPTLLIVGCGDIGLRVVRLLRRRWGVLALTSSPARCDALRAEGAVPLVGNLDVPETLGRLDGLADAVLHLAPPPDRGILDPRTVNLLSALARQDRVKRVVYASTSGVYGDCKGQRFDETRAVGPASDRGRRRVDAERSIRLFGRAFGVCVTTLRIPSIYANDRAGGRRANAWPVAHRCWWLRKTSSRTTFMPTIWRGPVWQRCTVARRSE